MRNFMPYLLVEVGVGSDSPSHICCFPSVQNYQDAKLAFFGVAYLNPLTHTHNLGTTADMGEVSISKG